MASRLPLILSCALFSGAAGAAELGDARVSSYLGQQLVADIELNTLDAPATPVQVRLAHPNVYRGANIGMPAVLSTLTMTVMQRDGRQFLHVTSTAPVESSLLHLYLELLDGGQRNVRLATLSMARNPNPPPPPPPPPPAPVKPPEPVAAEAPVAAPVAPKPAPPRPRPAPPRPVMVAKAEPTPAVKEEPKPEPKKEAQPAPKPAPALPSPPLPLASSAAPAACAPSGAEQSTVCAALDYKNAQLREQIDALEGKVRVLQVALGASPAEVSKPKPVDPSRPHPARKRPEPEPETSTPWGGIVAGMGALLALAGAVIVLLRRRKRAGQIQPMPRVSVMTRLRQRFARKKAARDPVEPQLDETGA